MKSMIWLSILISAIIMTLTQFFLGSPKDSSILLAVLFWLPIVQGSLAIVAAGELSNAKWINPIKSNLMSFFPLQFVFIIAFWLMGRDLSLYSWTNLQGDSSVTCWLSPVFFVGRMLVALLWSMLMSWLMIEAIQKNKSTKNIYAVLFLLGFVVTQSLLSVDWVMSLEYPWISTLFPLMFILEALLCGIAICSFLSSKAVKSGAFKSTEAIFSSSTMLLGFSLLSTGLWFAHHLTIWFANIPEEVTVLLRRWNDPFMALLITYNSVVGGLVPFILLLYRKMRYLPFVVSFSALAYLSSLIASHLVYVLPLASISLYMIVSQWVVLGFPVVWVTLVNQDKH